MLSGIRFVVAACVLASSACGESTTGASHGSGPRDAEVLADGRVVDPGQGGDGAAGGDGDASTTQSDASVVDPGPGAEYIFDDAVVHTFELTLAPEDLAFLDADPGAEIYVPGSFTFEGVEYPNVGVRYKGQGGAFNGCVEIRRMGEIRPMGAKTCAKLSIKISFNWADPQGRFFGLKKVLLHSMKNDPSMLRERLAYSTYRDHGVPASRAGHALLRINGENAGLYALVEEIDGRFTRDRFPLEGGKGNLYNEVWPLSSDPQRYIDALQSNRDQMPSAARMVALSEAVEAASDADLPAVIAQWMDMDHVIRLIAVDRAIRADDGPFHWWCNTNPTGNLFTRQRMVGEYNCGNHNYFWYEETAADRVWLLPWDMDAAFKRDDAASAIRFEWDDTDVDCSQPVEGNIGRHWPPSCDKLTRGWGTYQQQYVDSASELLQGAFSAAVVDEKLDRWVQQLTPIVEQGLVLDRHGLDLDGWLTEVDVLRNYIAAQRADTQARVERGP